MEAIVEEMRALAKRSDDAKKEFEEMNNLRLVSQDLEPPSLLRFFFLITFHVFSFHRLWRLRSRCV